jgi:hypothetical protein
MGLRSALGQAHDYRSCSDPDCPRFACKVYREGRDAGEAAGQAEGYTEGYAEGYCDGTADSR